MITKNALIFGITGQDGSYLAELLLSKNYEVHGVIRRSSTFNTKRIDHIFDKLKLHYCHITDGLSVFDIINTVRPNEIYNLAAQSHVKVSFDNPIYTSDVVAIGAIRILESIRKIDKNIKYYNAASSEMFGKIQESIQKETTPFYPRSPYACSKVFSFYTTINYRESYGIHASNGILFNHESPRRGDTFVTQKIVKGLVDIIKKKKNELVLGNLESQRDWGHAKDYVRAMWLMLQQDNPGDYVIATGKKYSVRYFLNKCIDYLAEKYVCSPSYLFDKIGIDKKYFRPTEVDVLVGDASKAKKALGWVPEYDLDGLIKDMIESYIND
jgi:GDPmannose 4,6-dehydratase